VERERFNAAREDGGLSAACGRALADDESVYIGQMVLDPKAFAFPAARWFWGSFAGMPRSGRSVRLQRFSLG